MIYLELPPALESVRSQSHEVAERIFRPISRKYDRAEHRYPEELEVLRSMSGKLRRVVERDDAVTEPGGPARNGAGLANVVSVMELCWGDVGLTLTIPGRGLGNAAIAAVATPEQMKRFGGKWASMAITEPGTGSDSAGIRTNARLEGDEWVLNGEKIFVTSGDRSELVVVWATLDRSMGKAAIKSFVVEKGTPGLEIVRLEHKLGIRASDTAAINFNNCRIPKENILGSPEIVSRSGFGGVMQTFDNTRPGVAAMSIGVARAALELTKELLGREGITPTYDKALHNAGAIEAEIYRMEADWEAARLLVLRAAWMTDNGQPNSKEASICKAKAGRMGNEVTLGCVALCGSLGYSENFLLEKWSRDSKILDIFEGTQQIQQLIVARKLLGKTSKELR